VDTLLGDYRRLAERRGAVLMVASDHGFLWARGARPRCRASRWRPPAGGTATRACTCCGAPASRLRRPRARGGATQVCQTLLTLLGCPRAAPRGPPLPGVAASSLAALDYRPHYQPVSAASALAGGADQEAIEKLKALATSVPRRPPAPRPARAAAPVPPGPTTTRACCCATRAARGRGGGLRQALELDPRLGSALWNLSDQLFQLKTDLDRSDALLVQAFAGGLPDSRRYLVERGIAYQRSGSPQRSLRLMQAAIEAKPDALEPRLFRGRYRVEAGDCAGALADFQAAVAMAPGDPRPTPPRGWRGSACTTTRGPA